jgi:1-deoxy-D-xylulose-5-phosphate synthase
MVETAVEVKNMLTDADYSVSLVNVRFVSPMDEELLHTFAKDHSVWVTMEENVKAGGYGEKVAGFLSEHGYCHIKLFNISLPNRYIAQGDVPVLKEKLGIDAASIFKRIIGRNNV